MALRKRTRRKITMSVLLLLICLVIYAVSSIFKQGANDKDNTEKQDIGQSIEIPKLEINIGTVGIDTFNPILTKNSDMVYLSYLIYDGLFDFDKDMKLIPNLVSEFNYNGNELYMTLKKDIKWHNGSKLTAKDVEFTINMIKEYGGIYRDFVSNIDKVEVVGDYALKLVLKDVADITHYDLIFPIISYDYYNGEDFKETVKNMQPIGTGMYMYDDTIDNKYVFKYNIDSKEKTQIGTINIFNYELTGQAFAGIKNKNIDMIFTCLTNYSDYVGTMGYEKEEYLDNSYLCVCMNKDNQYLSNSLVRKAINIAIDKETIFDQVYDGKGYVSQSIIYPYSYLYKNVDEIYDVDLAKQYLIDSKANNNLKLKLLVKNSDEKNIQVANLIQEQLEKVNVYVEIVSKGTSDYNVACENKDYDLVLVQMSISNNINMKIFKQGNYYDLFYFEDEELKKAIDTIHTLKNEEDRVECFKNIQEIIKKQVPYVGIGFKVNTVLFGANILGITDLRYNDLFMNISEFYKK